MNVIKYEENGSLTCSIPVPSQIIHNSLKKITNHDELIPFLST